MGEKNNTENKNYMRHRGEHTGRMTRGNMDKTSRTRKLPKQENAYNGNSGHAGEMGWRKSFFLIKTCLFN